MSRRLAGDGAWILGVALALAGACLGCVSEATLANQLVAAAQPGHLPGVVACWERQVEQAGLQGAYTLTADFVVEGSSSRLREARVTAVEPDDEAGKALGACVEAALGQAALPRAADGEGPGFEHGSDVAVRGYQIAFVGPEQGERERAEERQAHVLLGPRADRCQGLYRYAPPRDASALYAELAEQERKAEGAAGADRSQYARALQRAYDVQLELRERLRLDAAEPGLPQANRRRLLEALAEVERDAVKTGALIGCKP